MPKVAPAGWRSRSLEVVKEPVAACAGHGRDTDFRSLSMVYRANEQEWERNRETEKTLVTRGDEKRNTLQDE